MGSYFNFFLKWLKPFWSIPNHKCPLQICKTWFQPHRSKNSNSNVIILRYMQTFSTKTYFELRGPRKDFQTNHRIYFFATTTIHRMWESKQNSVATAALLMYLSVGAELVAGVHGPARPAAGEDTCPGAAGTGLSSTNAARCRSPRISQFLPVFTQLDDVDAAARLAGSRLTDSDLSRIRVDSG